MEKSMSELLDRNLKNDGDLKEKDTRTLLSIMQ